MREATFIGEFNFGDMDNREYMLNDKNFCYGHYTVNKGTATIAGFRINDYIYYGISFCSPLDNFSKTKGRENAEYNLVYASGSQKRGVMALDETTRDMSPTELFKIALERHLIKMVNKPMWTKNPVVDFRPKKVVAENLAVF